MKCIKSADAKIFSTAPCLSPNKVFVSLMAFQAALRGGLQIGHIHGSTILIPFSPFPQAESERAAKAAPPQAGQGNELLPAQQLCSNDRRDLMARQIN